MVNQYRLKKFYNKAKNLYETKENKNSDQTLLTKISTSGTIKDKLYSSSMMIQKNPDLCLTFLEKLISFVRTKKCRDSIIGVEILKELFKNHLLPKHDDIKSFEESFNDSEFSSNPTDQVLLEAYLNGEIKHNYKEYITFLRSKILEKTFDWYRVKLIAFSFELINGVQEGRDYLCETMIKSLAIPIQEITSKVIFGINKMIVSKPKLRETVAGKLRELLCGEEKSLSTKMTNVAVNILRRLRMSRDQGGLNLASTLMVTYLEFFDIVTSRMEDKEFASEYKTAGPKLLGLLINGIEKTLPFSEQKGNEFPLKKLDALFKTLHLPHFGTTVSALSLLFTVYKKNNAIPSRYLNALYQSLLSPELGGSKSLGTFLSLVFRSLKDNTDDKCVYAFVKRMAQVSTKESPETAAALLFTISELAAIKPWILAEAKNAINKSSEEVKDYDRMKRDPRYSGCEGIPLYELIILSKHFHPAVSKFSKTLLEGKLIEYAGDPTNDFSLKREMNCLVSGTPLPIC